MKHNPVISSIAVHRNNTAEQALVIRHQSALRAIERLDVSRELRDLQPPIPREAPDVMRVIRDVAGPCPLTGPRTGTHPMATYRPEPQRPMATRIRPPIEDFGPADEVLIIAVQCLTIAAAVMAAIALAGVAS